MTELASPPAADRPAHYRLKTETWEIILKEYVEGATAPFLAKKWRVSLHAIRKRISEHKATKRDWGDAQAVSQAQAREAELEAERRANPKTAAARLFDGLGPVDGDAGNPETLMRLATEASGRAMTGRLWSEAKALAGLAESYGRLAARGEPTIETVPVKLIYDILYEKRAAAEGRFGMQKSHREPPDVVAVKSAFLKQQSNARARETERVKELDALIADAEAFQTGWKAVWAEVMADDAKRATAEAAIARLKAEGLEIDPATGLPPRPGAVVKPAAAAPVKPRRGPWMCSL